MTIEIFYDGECPLCRSYVRLLRLRQQVGDVALIDARGEDPRVEVVRDAGLDLDAGMAVRYGDGLYHGPEAVWLLSILSEERGGVGRALRRLLSDADRARHVYPWLAAGRRLALSILGKQRIRQR